MTVTDKGDVSLEVGVVGGATTNSTEHVWRENLQLNQTAEWRGGGHLVLFSTVWMGGGKDAVRSLTPGFW